MLKTLASSPSIMPIHSLSSTSRSIPIDYPFILTRILSIVFSGLIGCRSLCLQMKVIIGFSWIVRSGIVVVTVVVTDVETVIVVC